jgi:hypothetical protein
VRSAASALTLNVQKKTAQKSAKATLTNVNTFALHAANAKMQSAQKQFALKSAHATSAKAFVNTAAVAPMQNVHKQLAPPSAPVTKVLCS